LRRYAARNPAQNRENAALISRRTIFGLWRRRKSAFPLAAKSSVQNPARARPIPEGWLMSFEANKIAGAILAAMMLAMISGIIANILVRPAPLSKPAYEIAGAPAEEAAAPGAAAAPAGPEPIAPLMASASADAGKTKTTQCAACHTFDKGGPNRIGPNLYGVVGSPIAEGRGGFAFSTALQTKGKGQTWTLDNLNAWLFKPQEFAKGTKMTFVGLPKAQDRANVVAYLNSMSDKPLSMAELTAGAATGAPAQGAAGAPTQGAAAAQGAAAKPAAPGAAPAPAQGAAPAQGGAAKPAAPAAAPGASAAPAPAPQK
jgi:cytochrome c